MAEKSMKKGIIIFVIVEALALTAIIVYAIFFK